MAFDAAAGFDEAWEGAGAPRRAYHELLADLDGADLSALADVVAATLERRGVSFGGRPFVIDPVPRLIGAEEWAELEAGLVQRTRALNAFLLDAYGDQRAIAAGVIPAEVVLDAEGFEHDLVGRLPSDRPPAAIIGFDVVRDVNGEFLVLEDNARTPSGFAYALAARSALLDCLPGGCPVPRDVHERTGKLLRDAVHAERQGGRRCPEPTRVVLTDGRANVAFYEHAEAARMLGAVLATPAQLASEGERLFVTGDDGRRREVDVVYRRTDEDRLRHPGGPLTGVAAALMPAWLSGRLGLVNAFGTGLADDKLVHAYVEAFVRFYLHEEPLLRSVPTTPVASEPEAIIPRLTELVVKPRHGHGGAGVVIGPLARQEELDRLARELEQCPGRYISQPAVALSRHPTVIGGRLEPRHVDLRAFAFAGREVALMPGGLSRVALAAGALVVNSSQQGGGKDTWVLP